MATSVAAGSIGKLIATTGLTVLSVTDGVTVTTNNDKTGYSLAVAPPTAAAIATAVLTDTGDNTTTGSPGKILAQLGGAFTTTSSSVYSTASLANAPTGDASDPWATALPGSYSAGEAGFIVGNNLNAAITSRMATFTLPTNFAALGITVGGKISEVALVDTLTTYTGNTPQTGDAFARIGSTGSGLTSLAPSSTALSTATWTNTLAGYLGNLNVGGNVASHADILALETQIGTPMQAGASIGVNLGQTLNAARALDTVADTALTLNDAFHCAVANAAGKESVSGTTYLIQTPSTGTILRTFTLDSGSSPTERT